MKINIRNYQSIKLGELEIKGLVGIIGANNSGKTNIMRALKSFIMNGFGATNINQGESEGSITVGNITLKRTVGMSSLIENGVEKNKLEGKPTYVLTKLDDFLVINNEKIKDILPQFSFTKEPLFPFNLTDSQIYYLFSMMFDMDTLNKIFSYIKSKIKEDENKIGYMKGKLDQTLINKAKLEKTIKILPPIEMIIKLQNRYNIIKLMNKHKKIREREENINNKVKLFNYLYVKIKLNKVLKLKEFLGKLEYLYLIKESKILQKIYDKVKNINNIPIEYLAVKKHLNVLTAQKDIIQLEYENIEKELSKFKICSVCGGIIK